MAWVIAIKTTLELYSCMVWHVKVQLVIESSSCVAFEWLLERNYRLWMFWNIFIGIDYGINNMFQVQFTFIHR